MTKNPTSEAKGMTREQKIGVAKRKLTLCPYPLKWFNFFTFLLILNVIFCVITTITDIAAISELTNSDNYAASAEAAPTTFGFAWGIIIFALLNTLFIGFISFLLLRKLSELDISAYKLLMGYLIYDSVSAVLLNTADDILRTILSYELHVEFSADNIIISFFFAAAIKGVWFFLNYKYFSKRYELFTNAGLYEENPDKPDYKAKYTPVTECPHCKEKISANTSFCEKCGNNII